DPVALPAPPLTGLGGALGSPLETERIRTSSLALADTMDFMDGRVLFTLGARRQTIKDEGFNVNTGARESRYDKSRVTPMAGIVFKARPDVALYANYIEGLAKGDTAS